MSDLELDITRVFDAPRSLVYAAWTRKEHADLWLAPNGYTIPFSNADLRPGGKWASAMQSPDGDELRLGGEYKEVIEGELLSFTHIWEEDDGPGHETLVTVRLFDEANGQTQMEFHQGVFKSVESRDGHKGGWSECFDKLAVYLARIKPSHSN